MTIQTGLPAKIVLKVAVLSEAVLLGAAILWAKLRGYDLRLDLSLESVLNGVLATMPLLLFNFFVFGMLANLSSRYNVYQDFKHNYIVPLCVNLNAFSALIVGIAPGLGEELFFRGVLNYELGALFTPVVGITLSSFLFSYVHFIGAFKKFWQLIAFYFLFGLYFSYLTIQWSSLTAAIVAHALYNFLAILYVRYYEIPRMRRLRLQIL